MSEIKRTIRMSEAIYPFGVGAIVDLAGESFISLDTSWWPKESRSIECKRLETSLSAGLRVPPSVPDRPSRDTAGLTLMRFPEWRFCQNCRRMSKILKRSGGTILNECLSCSGPMVPMRFIAICKGGSHVQDIPWLWWVHKNAENESQSRCKDGSLLEFVTLENAGEGLSGLMVVCRACDANRRLNELTGVGALEREGIRCNGRQPWEDADAGITCSSELQAIQRGSASTHLADTVSAIDIPEVESHSSQISSKVREHSAFAGLESAPTAPGAELRASLIAEDCGTTPEVVIALAQSGMSPLSEINSSLRGGEWAAFMRSLDGNDSTIAGDFIVRTEELELSSSSGQVGFQPLIERVGGVHRIREVRALTGFRRYSFEADLVRVDLGRKGGIPKWYPASETYGEGIFLQFSETAISEWEKNPSLAERAKVLEARRQGSKVGSRLQPVTPRYMLLHTLSHLLIRRLALESGYSSASLRERIYADASGPDRQAGILIYTSSGDSEGTLGGLVRQAKAPYLGKLLMGCLEDADNCSNDPLCLESDGQGMNAFNLAACHGCSLVSETSCENSNAILDRVTLVGRDQAEGYFAGVIQDARQKLGSIKE